MTDTSIAFVVQWFQKAADTAASMGKSDSAQLWKDGLQHLTSMHDEITRLQQERQGHLSHIALLKATLKAERVEADASLDRVKALQIALEHCLNWLPEDSSAACEAAALLEKS